MFSEIIFSKEKYPGYYVANSKSGNHLRSLNKVNIFIGQNNSGKSRFVRSLFSDDDFEFLLSNHDIKSLKEIICNKHKELRSVLDKSYIQDVNGLFATIDKVKNHLTLFKKDNTKSI